MANTYFFTITNSNPTKSYTLFSQSALDSELLPNGILTVQESDILRYKLDLYSLEIGDGILLFYSDISHTFSTICSYLNPPTNKTAEKILSSLIKQKLSELNLQES